MNTNLQNMFKCLLDVKTFVFLLGLYEQNKVIDEFFKGGMFAKFLVTNIELTVTFQQEIEGRK